ncbi:hypothetical protein Tco_1418948 [Tanacetum coccineum]
MTAPGSSNLVARRAVDELADFSSETEIPKYMKFFILQQIAKAKRFVNLFCDQAQTARTCIAHLNVMIFNTETMDDQEEAEEDISTKEAHVEIIEASINSV